MRNTKIINITIATIVFAIIGLPGQIFGQTVVSYSQTIALIAAFNKDKTYSAQTTGSTLNLIIYGMADNDYLFLSEGLKFRLGQNISLAKVKLEAAGALNVYEGNFLLLQYYTRHNIPPNLEDTALRSRVGGVHGQGTSIKVSMANMWKSRNITTNLIQCLEGFDPQTAANLVNVVCRPWYSPSAKVYENTDPTWASESLLYIYTDVNTVEVAKRSVVVKLLAEQGYIQIPTYTYAYFTWSVQTFGYAKWPDIYIYLDPVNWSASDIPSLKRLVNNPNYSAAARSALQYLGVAGY